MAMRVERERDGLAVEVPVRDELSPVHEDERVVRGRVDLDRHRLLGVGEKVAARAVHLRRAAKRVGVLHLVAPAVRLDDRGALEEANDVGRGGRLAGERAERLDLRHEADARALKRLEGEGARDVRGLGDPAGADERQRADGGHELGPVDEREPLLRLKADRLESGAGERVRPWKDLALVACRPLAHERKREMGERREISRRRRPSRGSARAGSTPLFRQSRRSSTVSTRAPEKPFASAFARSTIAARTTSSGYGSPTPHAWLRRRRSWSSSESSGGIAFETKRPKPVLMP